jgi:DNA polymerase
MAERGPLPVYLNFWGAKTTGRYSGGNKVNWQNLPARGPSAGLRDALLAPEGHTVLVGDSSNIELRMVMALAGQWDVVEKLKNGVDLYCDFASKLFGRNITKADKAERFLGKTAMLGLQYGAGAPRFQEMVRLAARQDPNLQEIELQRAYDIVSLYRQVHPQVVELWDRCHNWILPDIANGCSLVNVDVNGWFITQKDGFGRPGEPGVMYHDLQYNPRTKEWEYSMGRSRIRIYGPKIVENLSQHAAMRVVMWQTARINEKYPVKLSVHDEAVAVPKTEEITEARRYMEECLSLAPKWCRDRLPLACETGVGKSYGDAK